MEEWKGLIAARWTLVETFERDGKRFLIAERKTWIATLTQREREVVDLASLGRWNKLIAYELGIAASTVRVLLARAAAKAGVRTRSQLIERYLLTAP